MTTTIMTKTDSNNNNTEQDNIDIAEHRDGVNKEKTE